jgi:hypothetical protein
MQAAAAAAAALRWRARDVASLHFSTPRASFQEARAVEAALRVSRARREARTAEARAARARRARPCPAAPWADFSRAVHLAQALHVRRAPRARNCQEALETARARAPGASFPRARQRRRARRACAARVTRRVASNSAREVAREEWRRQKPWRPRRSLPRRVLWERTFPAEALRELCTRAFNPHCKARIRRREVAALCASENRSTSALVKWPRASQARRRRL